MYKNKTMNGLRLFKDPFFDTIDNVFEKSLSSVFDNYRFGDNPDVRINKTEDEYNLLVSVPGLSKDDLKLTIKDNELVISYEKEEKNKNSYFTRSFTKIYSIPDDVSQDKIEASVKDGVLELKLPFHEKKSFERVIEIE